MPAIMRPAVRLGLIEININIDAVHKNIASVPRIEERGNRSCVRRPR
jgi:hypothetical protein